MRKNLTKREIIRKKPDIDKVFRRGQSVSCRGMKLITAPNGLEFSRIIVIPVKHYGNSVERNRIRRQIKEFWRCSKEYLMSGFDFVFLVYPGKVSDHDKQVKKLINLCVEAGVYLSIPEK